jgi:DNA-binding CsgD family transcriptional regulator
MTAMSARKSAPQKRRRQRRNQAIVVATPEGKIRYADQIARRWLKQFFGRPARAGLLPRQICRWLSGQQQSKRPGSATVGRTENAKLFLRQQHAFGEKNTVLLLELIKGKGEERARRYRGLTAREREVLLWLSRGKSNAEIAAILAIKVATVSKHLERIYPKLGVESRSAAINVRLENA